MSRYRRVTDEERLLMQAYLAEGLSFSAIASKLGFDRSTISREVARNSGDRGYRVKQACRKADERQRYRLEPRKMVQETVRKPIPRPTTNNGDIAQAKVESGTDFQSAGKGWQADGCG